MPVVLVVEDDRNARNVICSTIKREGYFTLGCRNGLKGWELLQGNQQGIHIVVTDLNMPEMNGKELISRIREHAAMVDLPIIVFSAYVEGQKKELLNLGVSAIMSKPMDLEFIMKYIKYFAPISCP
ncbi:MAG: response regulator [Proteobacteria bacterium]|nr:response regulator [Pseudomonadota bacterium]